METQSCEETRLFYKNRPATPIGRLESAGYLKGPWRFYDKPMRLLGCFSLVYVTEGEGRFSDALGTDHQIQAGDLIVLFPDVAHKYGQQGDGQWSELYAYFDGPIFDLWQQVGLLNPAKPVHRQERGEYWRAQLELVLTATVTDDKPSQVSHLLKFLTILTQMTAPDTLAEEGKFPPWLRAAFVLLGEHMSTERPLAEIAEELEMTYSTFRKHFEKATGQAPSQYRFARRMETACSMLVHTKMKVWEIAESLNFSDAFHFSNRFQSYTGLRPSIFRKEGRLREQSSPPSAGRGSLNTRRKANQKK